MKRRTVGFYRKNGRIRPITSRTSGKAIPLPHMEKNGFWIEKNGERTFMLESEIPEEYRLDVPLGFKYEKNPERYRKDSIGYLQNRINGLKSQWFDARNQEDRELIQKLIPYYQSQIEEYKKYRLPTERNGHLYRNGAKDRERKKFEREYGKRKGDYVYGAVVGKVRRERQMKGRK